MSDERIPVEPLSERRWQQIRKSVLERAATLDAAAQPERPSRRPRWVLAGVAIGVAAACLLWMTPSPPATTVATSRVITESDAATMTAGDVTVDVEAHTSVLSLEGAENAWTVSIEHGRAHFSVPPRGDRPPFVVEAGRTRIEVVGTSFTVTRVAGEPSASVEVEHGIVRVTDGDESVLLHDGERWPAVAPVHTTTARTEAVVAPIDPPLAPPASTLHAPVVATSARDRYRAAEARESRDPSGALAAYAAIEREGGPWSAPALMSQARLEAELGHDPRARTLAERYLAEHADGINAEDARDLLRRLR